MVTTCIGYALPCLALPCLALPCLALPCLAWPGLAWPGLVMPFSKELDIIRDHPESALFPQVTPRGIVSVE